MKRQKQRGGFFLGLIIGLLVGLGLAMAVSLYISKVPSPFVNKVPQRTAEQDAAETEKNKSWDPNSGLYGKNPARPSASATNGASGAVLDPSLGASKPRKDTRNPADILADKPLASAAVTSAANGASSKPSTDALATYFVQSGAFTNADDAEEQRGKLAMMGYKAKISEREQSGRTVFRVRLGPFDKRETANLAKEKLDNAGMDAALVQVQK
jgi:cell division protein FtsN